MALPYHIVINNINSYDFMESTYNGCGGYRTGLYLVPHGREMDTDYESRKEMNFFRNYLRPVVRAKVDPIFNADIKRIVFNAAGNELSDTTLQGFWDNCTNSGIDASGFMRNVMVGAVLHGCTFVVMDNFKADEIYPTELENNVNRKYPYVYEQKKNSVENFKLDKFSNLQEITFIAEEVDKIQQYRKWDSKRSVMCIKTKTGELEEIPGTENYHNLGEIPVRCVSFGGVMYDSEFYDLAKMNWTIYNLDSELRELIRKQGYSLLCVYEKPPEPGSMTLGTSNVLFTPDAQQQSHYVSPDVGIPKLFEEIMDSIRAAIFQIAEQNGVVGVQAVTSGLAKQWDFRAQAETLKTTAEIAEDCEEWMAKIFLLYTKQDLNYAIEYEDDYNGIIPAEKLNMLQSIIDNNISPSAVALAKKQIVKIAFNDIEDSDMIEVMKEIDEQGSSITE